MNRIFIIILLLFSFTFSFSQKNKFNRRGQRTGKWLTYSDSAKTKKLFEGKYRNGNSVGTSYYYSIDGNLEKKEKKRFRKLRTTFYHTNGVKSQEGMARVDNLTDRIHYYFYGEWKYYDEKGNLISYAYYKKGELQKTVSLIKPENARDTFCTTLVLIEKLFLEKNKDLIDTLAFCWNNPSLAEKYRNKIYQADSMSFKQIENSFVYFGYPTKEVCGDAANVPFFVFSHAPVKLRERYIELFKAAADLGSISKSSLAFYIDKVKITKGEKQVYGTQFYMNKEKNIVYYTSIDPDNLGKRRLEMGLEEKP